MLLAAKLGFGLETWNKSNIIDIGINENACGRIGYIQPTTNSNRCIEPYSSSRETFNYIYLLKIYVLSESIHNKAGFTEIARFPCPTTQHI